MARSSVVALANSSRHARDVIAIRGSDARLHCSSARNFYSSYIGMPQFRR